VAATIILDEMRWLVERLLGGCSLPLRGVHVNLCHKYDYLLADPEASHVWDRTHAPLKCLFGDYCL
jgi:hypothetical protein